MSLFSFFFTKYAVSFAGREGTTGPKGSPGSPGAPGFPGAQVRLGFFRLFFRSHKNYFRETSRLVLTCSVILGDLNSFLSVVMNVSAWEA